MKNYFYLKAILSIFIITLALALSTCGSSKSGSTPGQEIDPDTVATPTASPPEGEVESGTTIELSTDTVGAEIWYTIDGIAIPEKDGTKSTRYTDPIPITVDTIIMAIAVKDGMNDSNILGV